MKASNEFQRQIERINNLTRALATITTRAKFNAWMKQLDAERRRPGYFTAAAPSATEIQAQREMDEERVRENTI